MIKLRLVEEIGGLDSKRAPHGTDPLLTWEVKQPKYASTSLYLEWEVEVDSALANMLANSRRTERKGKGEE